MLEAVGTLSEHTNIAFEDQTERLALLVVALVVGTVVGVFRNFDQRERDVRDLAAVAANDKLGIHVRAKVGVLHRCKVDLFYFGQTGLVGWVLMVIGRSKQSSAQPSALAKFGGRTFSMV